MVGVCAHQRNTIRISKIMKKTLSLIAAISLMAGSASAIQVDEIIFQNGAGLDSSQLHATVGMSLTPIGVAPTSLYTLHISLQNTSLASAGDGALVLLTGLAFDLPSGVTVDGSNNNGGSVAAGSGTTTSAGWTTAGANGAWGWDNNSAGLSGGALAYATLTGYDTRVSTVASDGKNAFDGSGNAGGMDYGVFSASETSVSPAPWVKDELDIALNLNLGNYDPSSLLAAIDAGNVAAIFGSPNGTPGVPDGGSTLALFGASILGIGALRRRFSK